MSKIRIMLIVGILFFLIPFKVSAFDMSNVFENVITGLMDQVDGSGNILIKNNDTMSVNFSSYDSGKSLPQDFFEVKTFQNNPNYLDKNNFQLITDEAYYGCQNNFCKIELTIANGHYWNKDVSLYGVFYGDVEITDVRIKSKTEILTDQPVYEEKEILLANGSTSKEKAIKEYEKVKSVQYSYTPLTFDQHQEQGNTFLDSQEIHFKKKEAQTIEITVKRKDTNTIKFDVGIKDGSDLLLIDPYIGDPVDQSLGLTLASSSSVSGPQGELILTKAEADLISIFRYSSVTATNGYLMHPNGTNSTCFFSGNNCTFANPPRLLNNTYYYVFVDSGTGSYTRYYKEGGLSWPITSNTLINWISGYDGTSNRTDVAYVLDKLVMWEWVPDIYPPDIFLIQPENVTYTLPNVSLRVSSTDTDIANWTYTLDGGDAIFFTPNITLTGLSQGSHILTVFVNDTNGNSNSTTLRFSNWVNAPDINVYSPAKFGAYLINNISLNVSSGSPNVTTWWWTNDSGKINHTFTPNTTLFNLPSGDNGLDVYVNDSYGKLNSTSVDFTILSTTNFNITNLTLGFNLSQGSTVSVAMGELILTKSNIYLVSVFKDSAVTATRAVLMDYPNLTVIATAEFVGNNATFLPMESLTNDTYYFIGVDNSGAIYTRRYNDSGLSWPVSGGLFNYVSGFDGTSNRTDVAYNLINVYAAEQEVTLPSFTLVSPQNRTYKKDEAITLNVTTKSVIENWTYSTDFGTNNITFTPNITLSLPEGTTVLEVYANDSSGNVAKNSVTLFKDSIPNDIFVFSPQNTTYSNQFNISLNVSSTGNVDTWWYSNDSGETNVTFTPNITLVNLPYGSTTVLVWNNDSVNNVNSSSVTFAIVQNSPPVADNANFTILDLLNGNESLSITFNISDSDGLDDLSSCWVQTSFGNFTATNQTGSCNTTLTIPQNQTIEIRGYVNDSNGEISNTSLIEGVQVYLYRYIQDTSQTSNFTEQHFLEEYNITSSNPGENIQWSRNTTDDIKTINISSGQNLITKSNYTADFVDEATSYTFSGSLFTAGQAYSVTRYITYNNTLTNVSLGEILLTVNTSDVPFSSGMDVEKQITLYQDINYSFNTTDGFLTFNLTTLNATQKDNYRYTYDGVLVSILNDIEADYRLSGTQKEWTYTPSYLVNLDLSGKTVNHTIQTIDTLPEWNAKVNWGSVLLNSSGSSLSHTSTDNSNTLFISFNPIKDIYDLTVTYYTTTSGSPGGGGGAGGGGGGGGGGGVPLVIPQIPTANQTSQSESQALTVEKSKVNWVVPYVPSKSDESIVVKMETGNLRSTFTISKNLADYITLVSCNEDNTRCVNDKLEINQGETGNLFIFGQWSEEFGEVLQQNKQVTGYIEFQAGGKIQRIEIVVERAPLFKVSKDLSDALQDDEGALKDIPVSQKLTFLSIFSSIATSLGGIVVWGLLKGFGY